MKSQGKRRVWVIIHCEIFHFGKEYVVDEMVFHVSSSKRKAESYVKEACVSSYSWWKVQYFDVDQSNEKEVCFYYTYKGKAVTSPSSKQAIANFKKSEKYKSP
jgi:hypothetical protein